MITGVVELDPDLQVLAAGIRGGVLPEGPPLDKEWVNRFDLGPRERDDLKAFRSTGWQFHAVEELEWRTIADLNAPSPIHPGLLARKRGGGLLIVTNRLAISFTSPRAAEYQLASHYDRWRPLTFGRELFEVELPVPDRSLQADIRAALKRLKAASGEGGGVRFAEPTIVYRLSRPLRVGERRPPPSRRRASPQRPDPFEIDRDDQWQWTILELEEAWKASAAKVGQPGAFGAGITVAVIDLGFHLKEPQIALNIRWDQFLDQNGEKSKKSMPRDPHGTSCAALAGAIKDDRSINGAAPGCSLALVAIPRQGVCTQTGLGSAIDLCVKGNGTPHRADVISCSLGPNDPHWPLGPTLQQAIDDAHAHGGPIDGTPRGTPVVWATFNCEAEIEPGSVLAYEPLVCVSRSDRWDARIDSGHCKGLDFIAPGEGVLILKYDASGSSSVCDGFGSSLAAPSTAGVVALMLAANPALSWKDVSKVLNASCDPQGKTWDGDVGWGRLNARLAVEAALARRVSPPAIGAAQPPP